MKNYLKISVLLVTILFNNSAFTSEHCYLTQYNTDEEIKEFFGNYNLISTSGSMVFERNDINQNNSYTITDGLVKYMTSTSNFILGAGVNVSIIGDSKFFISGRFRCEKNNIINIGDKDTGGCLIINSLYTKNPEKVLDLRGLTINLNNENSHLEIHANNIRLKDFRINQIHPKATYHIHDKLIENVKFNPLVRTEDEIPTEMDEDEEFIAEFEDDDPPAQGGGAIPGHGEGQGEETGHIDFDFGEGD